MGKETFKDKINPLKDYEKNSEGKYVYKGIIYKCTLNKDEFNRLYKKYWLINIIMIIVCLFNGFVPFKGMMYKLYVVIPFCIELVCLLMLLRSMVVFSDGKETLTERQYKKSVENINVYTIFIMIVCAIAEVVGVIYVVNNGFNNDLIYYITYCLINILLFLLSSNFYHNISKLQFEKKDNSK